LVCSATAVISLTTSPIRAAAALSSATDLPVSPAIATAWRAMPVERSTSWLISAAELVSCVVAAATVCMLTLASSEAAATVVTRSRVPSAPCSRRSAMPLISVEAFDTSWMMVAIAVSNRVVFASNAPMRSLIALVAPLIVSAAARNDPCRPSGRIRR
jgi:hypothetical protein